MTRPRIVIIGAGFGGLAAAKALKDAPVDVTVLDRTNHHLFQPLLYQVATAGLAAPSIAAPIRHVLRRQANTTVLLAEVVGIDVPAREVLIDGEGETGRERIPYDHLIVAAGATHSYFGRDDWAEHAPGLKTLDDAYAIRNRILATFEQAERLTDPSARAACLRFVVIGGGPTGVEMAGTLAEIARHTLPGEFRRFDARSTEVLLLEGGPRVLAAYPEDLSDSARRQLESLGVQVRLNARVTAIDARGVDVSTPAGSERIGTGNVIWGAGVKASPLGQLLAQSTGATLDRAGRVQVLPDLSLPLHPEISVIGDLAVIESGGKSVPGIAPAAKQMGWCAAANVQARIAGQPVRPFVYKDYGSMATIGRHRAIAQMGRFKFGGIFAWWLWLFAHVFFLIGFRNRIAVMIDWAAQYWTMQRHARIFLAGDRKRQ
ncbi:NAD(P)/FAD-dependent oxidoreductase [Piscinibacterium candidicorallinum]|uniref:NADH:ubiquinone reductase (non-electrogenic) n=1 Tax=Piscinibacterium candidicorallinum TaxID=1793872 RepID=A0ABV7H3P2_9BURK